MQKSYITQKHIMHTIPNKPPEDHIERLEKAHKILRRQKSKYTPEQLWAKFKQALETQKQTKKQKRELKEYLDTWITEQGKIQ